MPEKAQRAYQIHHQEGPTRLRGEYLETFRRSRIATRHNVPISPNGKIALNQPTAQRASTLPTRLPQPRNDPRH
eukprot:jgi/Psemu1/9156/gm1.9156_g